MPQRLLIVTFFLAACDGSGNFMFLGKEVSVDPLSEVNVKLQFTCAYEKFPVPAVESEVVFKYARWLQKNNQLKQDSEVYGEIERLYRVASEHGHAKANINLQNGGVRGYFKLSGEEHLRLSQQLIDEGVATGYYFIGVFLGKGAAGLQMDEEMALRYFRKAADEGSASAQYFVAERLAPLNAGREVARQMRKCAAHQGYGNASVAFAIYLKRIGDYQQAVEVFQGGVSAGDESASSFLANGFLGPGSDDRVYYLGQQKDLERAERYRKITSVLSNYSYANPVVPEINEIVPLPPADLPPWDGKLQWLEDRLANIPPEKPSEALIQKLAKEKVLDPATGKPMPGSPAFSEANFPVMICESDQPCPQTGYWKVMVDSLKETVRHFEQGEIMPRYRVTWTEPRIWPLQDKVMKREERIEWGLLG